MPTNRLIAKEKVATYGTVLFDAVLEEGGQQAVLDVREELSSVIAAQRENAELAEILNGSEYTPEQRSELIKNVFAMCNPVLLDVLAVVAERGDGAMLSRIFECYGEQLESKLNLRVVDVTTVVPLDDNLRDIIKRKVEADLGAKVALREYIDESILGGLVMSMGDKRIDASVSSQLDHARIVLKQSNDGGEC